jgi:uncharacterized cupin superfamily protein
VSAVYPILSLDTLQLKHAGHEDKFSAQMGRVATQLGLKNIGAMLMVVQPNEKAFPFHHHHVNDEMFIILEGEGTYRYGDESLPFKAGDVLGAPSGVDGKAHQIINTGKIILKYLSISTQINMDIVEYPDSGKFGAFAGERENGKGLLSMPFAHMSSLKEKLDYWEGE